jgi:uncharacterized phage protein (TIGR02218 family)
MKTIPAAMDTHLLGDVTTLAWCWKATRKDGQIFGFTTHDINLKIDNVIYYAETGLNATNAQAKVGTSVDNLEVAGMLDSSTITEQDLRSGLWDMCSIEVFIVNWMDVTQRLIVQAGTLGDVTIKKQQFISEMRSLSQFLQNTIGRIMTKRCDASFGDSRCGLALGNYTRSSSVSAITDYVTISTSNNLNTTELVTDASFTSAILAMPMDGADNGTSFTDNIGKIITRTGTAIVTKKVFGTSSAYNPGNVTGSYLSAATSTDFILHPSDFTIEFWLNPLSNPSVAGRLLCAGGGTIAWNSTTGIHWLVQHMSGGLLDFYWYDGNISWYRVTTSIKLNTFQHIAIESYLGTTTIYLNGIAQQSNTNPMPIIPSTTPSLHIFSIPGENAGNYMPNCYLDELRITKGIARYQGEFIPNSYPYTQSTSTLPQIIANGKLTWTSGLNKGASIEVKSIGSSTIGLTLPMANDISIGDTFNISSGCDKNFNSTTGCSFYNNRINFRGYPHIPGMDKIMDYPNAK